MRAGHEYTVFYGSAPGTALRGVGSFRAIDRKTATGQTIDIDAAATDEDVAACRAQAPSS
jgi:hypothetical protein